MKRWPSAIASSLAVVLGFSSLAIGTDGWQAWTAENARRLDVLKNPVSVPAAALINQRGDKARLHIKSSPGSVAPLVLMEFIYTRCPKVCFAMGAEFRRLQGDLISAGQQDQVKLLSLSFDQGDSLDDLSQYLDRFAAEPGIWSAARFEQAGQLEKLMQRLGVVVIPEPDIGFIHNAAIYVIQRGTVVAILDYDDRVGLRAVIDQHLTSI